MSQALMSKRKMEALIARAEKGELTPEDRAAARKDRKAHLALAKEHRALAKEHNARMKELNAQADDISACDDEDVKDKCLRIWNRRNITEADKVRRLRKILAAWKRKQR